MAPVERGRLPPDDLLGQHMRPLVGPDRRLLDPHQYAAVGALSWWAVLEMNETGLEADFYGDGVARYLR